MTNFPPLPLKTHLGFPGQTLHTCPCSSLLEKEYSPAATDKVALGRLWLDFSGLHCCISFSCCFCSVSFAVINLSSDCYLLLSRENPSGESSNKTHMVSVFLYTISLRTSVSLAFSRKNLFTTKASKALLSKFY